jgi:DNA repair exonuclease SbcCD ATPase subunit
MKLLRLQVRNIMRVSELDLDLDGHHLVLIGGKNGQGKTSAIQALLMALCGKRGMDFPEVPLKDGEREGSILIATDGDDELQDLNGFTIEMKFRRTRGGKIEQTFEVRDSTGDEAPTPRAILDKLFTLRALDPLEFEKSKPKDRVNLIRQMLGLDFAELDAEYAETFSERTVVNRSIKQAEAQVAAVKVPAGAPNERIALPTLLAERDAAVKANQQIVRTQDAIEDAQKDIYAATATIDRLMAEVEQLKKKLKHSEAVVAEHTAKLESMNPIDTAPIDERIQNAESLNAAFDLKVKRDELRQTERSLCKRADELTDRLDEIKATKQKMMEEAAWPVPGMSFDEEGVLLNGLPFEQASRAERIRTSVKIAMAMNPKLRLMVTQHGSDCDMDTLKQLEELLVAEDYQLIAEFVTRSPADEGLCAVVFEDGTAREV